MDNRVAEEEIADEDSSRRARAAYRMYSSAARGRDVDRLMSESKRLELLEISLDEQSRVVLDDLPTIASAIEVGPGRGSIVKFLSDRVGPDGVVIAVDTTFDSFQLTNEQPNVVKVCRNIEEPMADIDRCDLVHARLVLHLVRRRSAALENLWSRVKPGGFFFLENIDISRVLDSDVRECRVAWAEISDLAKRVGISFSDPDRQWLESHGATTIKEDSDGVANSGWPKFWHETIENLAHALAISDRHDVIAYGGILRSMIDRGISVQDRDLVPSLRRILVRKTSVETR